MRYAVSYRDMEEIMQEHGVIKAFYSAQATIHGIETAHLIREGQLNQESIPDYF